MTQPKPEELESIRQRAENMVRSTLVLKEIAIKESIKLDTDKFQARVGELATQLGKSVEEAQQFLSEKGITQRLRDEILTDQLFEFLVGHAKISK
jgi:FKBP-type peptidyl-prolyl cis-trans isomerase (trigger factor)